MTVVGVTAQTIGGRVSDESRQPIVGATVVDVETGLGTVTDGEGLFRLNTGGKHPKQIVVRCLGFETDTVEVAGRRQGIEVTLRTISVEGRQVDVVGRRKGEDFQRLDPSIATSTVGADGGVEGVIKTQMGVSSNSELSSQYRVRGGNFDENIVYVGGVEIYRPFLIRAGEQEGLSFVNPDMVQELSFSAGGFDASYGDKMSSVLDVSYKRPERGGGGFRLSLLGASAHAEGAVGGGRLTHITGVRYKTNQYLFGSLDTKGDYSPTFFDVQTYWTVRASERLSIGVLAYYASNSYKFVPTDRETTFGTISDAKKLTIYFEGKERDKYQTAVTAANAQMDLSESQSIGVRASMFRTSEQENYDILGEYWLQEAVAAQAAEPTDLSDNIGVGGYMQHARNDLFGEVYSVSGYSKTETAAGTIRGEIRQTFEHYKDVTDEWEYTDSAGYITSPSAGRLRMVESRRADNQLREKRTEGYVVMRSRQIGVGSGQMWITAGVRAAYQTDVGETYVSPRASVSVMMDKWRLRLSGGRYCQIPTLREMKRDDASLNRGVKPQDSWQAVFGADFYPKTSRPMKLTFEAYYKGLRDLNPYSIDNVRLRYMAENNAKGYAAGMDVKINGELVEGVESWATLSVMKTAEKIDGDTHGYIPRPSDQRVQGSMMVQDQMPNNRSISAMLNLYFASGLPFGPQGSARWQQTSRMPGYKRVDLGLYKDFAKDNDGNQKRERLKMAQFGIEVFNLMDFANTISHFWVRDTEGHRYGVPNYLTSRRINVKVRIEF